jgi:hypothetical protein
MITIVHGEDLWVLTPCSVLLWFFKDGSQTDGFMWIFEGYFKLSPLIILSDPCRSSTRDDFRFFHSSSLALLLQNISSSVDK